MEARLDSPASAIIPLRPQPDPERSVVRRVAPVSKGAPAQRERTSGEFLSGGTRHGLAAPAGSRNLPEMLRRPTGPTDVGIHFEIQEETGDVSVEVMNRETGELIRRIPPEDVSRLHQKLEELRGLLVDKKA
ncbi:MAG: flagellar protein FlaG [bacterium]